MPLSNINIAIGSSDEYAKFLYITVASLIHHSSCRRQYQIFVLNKNITEKSKARILSLVCGAKNFRVHFIDMSGVRKFLCPSSDDRRVSEETYYRVFVPWILSDVNRVVAIDCDMVFNDDIAFLFDTDIRNNLVGAVRDIVAEGEAADFKLGKWIYVERMLKLKRPYRIFNGGLTLLNLKRIRNCIELEDVKDLLRNNVFTAYDQDVFNRLYAGKCYEIDMAWNYIVLSSPQLVQCYDAAPEDIRRLYDKSAADIKVFHFLGAIKPWNNSHVPHADQFWKYVLGSPFEEEIRKVSLRVDKDKNGGETGKFFSRVFPIRSWRRLIIKFLLPCRGSPIECRLKRLLNLICNRKI